MLINIVFFSVIYLFYQWVKTQWNSSANITFILPAISILSFIGIPATAYFGASQSTIAKDFPNVVIVIWLMFVLIGIIASILCLSLGLTYLRKNIKSISQWIMLLVGVSISALLFYMLIISWGRP